MFKYKKNTINRTKLHTRQNSSVGRAVDWKSTGRQFKTGFWQRVGSSVEEQPAFNRVVEGSIPSQPNTLLIIINFKINSSSVSCTLYVEMSSTLPELNNQRYIIIKHLDLNFITVFCKKKNTWWSLKKRYSFFGFKIND